MASVGQVFERRSRRLLRPLVTRAVIGLLVLTLALLASGCADLVREQTDTTEAGSTRTTGGAPDDAGQDQDDQDRGANGRTGTTVALDDRLVSPAEAVAEAVSPSVVNVAVSGVVQDFFGQRQEQILGQGSGVIFSEDGMIVTNNHVVTDQRGRDVGTVTVTLTTGEELEATIVGRDPVMDLAVIKIDKTGLPAATFIEDFSEVKVGQYAIAIGSPLGFENSVTLGVVSGVQREIEFPGAQRSLSLIDLIQTDAAISPGNSGGALVDGRGRVIGINVAYLPPAQTGAQDLGFAIPADVVVDVAQQIIETGQAQHPYLGIFSVSVSRAEGFDLSRDSGVLVAEVTPGTPAADAGLQEGDIIFEIDGEEIDDQSDLFALLRRARVGQTVEVKVDRGSEEVTLNVTLGDRPLEAQ